MNARYAKEEADYRSCDDQKLEIRQACPCMDGGIHHAN